MLSNIATEFIIVVRNQFQVMFSDVTYKKRRGMIANETTVHKRPT